MGRVPFRQPSNKVGPYLSTGSNDNTQIQWVGFFLPLIFSIQNSTLEFGTQACATKQLHKIVNLVLKTHWGLR